ncbi:MAG TPA: type II toxin-antitoxin system RelE/ParE family toxin [Nevskiales bacterium]|nr:type II toxin-antitoxin system RelE/ParE family toxin [Nevskiales bacterium]
MAWDVEFKQSAFRQLEKLDRAIQRRILAFLKDRVTAGADPRLHGKALQGDRQGLWRYRVGDYRIICEIQDHRLVVLVLSLGHRKEIYRGR